MTQTDSGMGEYYLAANDEQGKPFIWGFYFPTLEKAKRALLPNTWVVDKDGKELARRASC